MRHLKCRSQFLGVWSNMFAKNRSKCLNEIGHSPAMSCASKFAALAKPSQSPIRISRPCILEMRDSELVASVDFLDERAFRDSAFKRFERFEGPARDNLIAAEGRIMWGGPRY